MQAQLSFPIPRIPLTASQRLGRLFPGIALCMLLVLMAALLARVEMYCLGEAMIGTLVLAILLGVLLRTGRAVPGACLPGIRFCSKPLLEMAIVLLGASVDFPALLNAGPRMLLAIALAVVLSILVSYAIGKALGLKPKLALLVACGNSICGSYNFV